ncbi:MAG: NAD-binding protein [Candidatus Delongbacteria bacterium]|nr:NAD-binding protein [Candidatus Delongbacteria bacterium]
MRLLSPWTRLWRSETFKLTLVIILFALLSSWLVLQAERTGGNQLFQSIGDSLWWFFVTIFTVGYGDKYPVTVWGRAIGILIMFLGIGLLSLITGRIASFLIERNMLKSRGLIKLNQLKGHIIICGWKSDMPEILKSYFGHTGSRKSALVLVNTQESQTIESFLSEMKDEGIYFVRGDWIEENTLSRANVTTAQKILILSDQTQSASDQAADSKTVMGVITVKTINPKVYVIAEIMDEKFTSYLHTAGCDEIILSRKLSQSLLSNTLEIQGLSTIFKELLNQRIRVVEIGDEWYGKPFRELAERVRQDDKGVLLGLLENTGNFYQRKKEAINEAQKTTDISKLVTNLKKVKELTANQPVILPMEDYTIMKGSKMIILDGGHG